MGAERSEAKAPQRIFSFREKCTAAGGSTARLGETVLPCTNLGFQTVSIF